MPDRLKAAFLAVGGVGLAIAAIVGLWKYTTWAMQARATGIVVTLIIVGIAVGVIAAVMED